MRDTEASVLDGAEYPLAGAEARRRRALGIGLVMASGAARADGR